MGAGNGASVKARWTVRRLRRRFARRPLGPSDALDLMAMIELAHTFSAGRRRFLMEQVYRHASWHGGRPEHEAHVRLDHARQAARSSATPAGCPGPSAYQREVTDGR